MLLRFVVDEYWERMDWIKMRLSASIDVFPHCVNNNNVNQNGNNTQDNNDAESMALRGRLSEKSNDAAAHISYTVDGDQTLNESGQVRDRSTEDTTAYTGL